jgi:ribokinase
MTDLPAGAAASVVVVGSLNVDTLLRVDVLPRPGETVIARSEEIRPGGKGGNQACAAARLGARTTMIGALGSDVAGRQARDALESAGVDVAGIVTCDQPTGAAVVIVENAGENLIVVKAGANAELTADHVRERLRAHGAAVVLVSLEISVRTAMAAAETAAGNGWTVVLNAAPSQVLPVELLAACDVVVANEHEVTQLGPDHMTGLLAAGPRAVVVTAGRRGANLHLADGSVHHQAAFPVEAIDTTGAGDAFCGGLAWALAAGHDLIPAVRVAAAVGALATRAAGARGALPDEADLEQLLRRGDGFRTA